MKTCNLKKQIVGLILFLAVCGVYSQQPSSSEEENKAKAQELFDAKNYQEAMPLYAQLVSVYSNNSEYNYKFGVCALYGDRSDRRRPIRYLNNALKSMGDNPELNYHLGIAYYQNQEFANAMKFLNLYLAKLDPGSSERPAILEQVNACLNGMNLEHQNLIAEIISTSEFQTDNYHRAYRADEFDGMLILKPENLISAKEKSSGRNSFVFISEPRGTVYFSGYENGSGNNKDIYKVLMDENGGWGTPEKISGKINTLFDEDYPVMTNGGTTLYFCSKGHNTIGGYDIFKSTFDAASKSFSEPENLGMGINSPFDDVLFIPDKTGGFAYFSTNRDNLNNSINVYKVRLNENTIGEELMLAKNNPSSNESKIEQNQQAETKTAASENNQAVIAHNTEPEVAPTVKAAELKRDMASMNLMADTAFMLVTNTKSLIRSLTNKRDRANALCAKKKEEAQELELLLDQELSKIHEYTGEEEFEVALQKTVELKKQIVQKQKGAEHANLIAWKIGKYIKIKNEELQTFKEEAGNVQSMSVSSNVDETEIVYTELMNRYMSADTLEDFSTDMLHISQDANSYTVPEKALAFAEDLKQGFLNNTLIADAAIKKPETDPSIPIVVVDNRTTKTIVPEVPKVVVAKQIEKVQWSLADNTPNMPEEEAIEISFSVDAIDALPVVEQIAYNNMDNELIIEEELEINIEREIQVIPLVQTVLFAEASFEIEETALELRFDIDAIKAFPMIELIAYNDLNNELLIDEELEINIEKEMQVVPLIQAVLLAETSSEIEIDDPSLELNFDVDRVEPTDVVETIAYNDLNNETIIAEELEINIEEEVMVIPVVQPVFLASTSNEIEIDDPSLELRFEADVYVALPIVQMVAYNFTNETMEEEEDLELGFSIDRSKIPSYGLIQPIRNERYADLIEIEDDNLEINIEKEKDEINVARLVNSIPLTFSETIIIEEDIEIDFSVDFVAPENKIEPVYANLVDDNFANMEEEIEINLDKAPVETAYIYKLVQPVYKEKLTISNSWPEETELEIGIDTDEIETFELISPVDYVAFAMDVENDVEINYVVDALDNAEQLAVAINSFNQRLSSETINSMPAIGVELFYLREALEIANDIETSRTDFEMLTVAITNPDDLSYEELLYAASLAQAPKDKLSIFNEAFIHIDRDWRAFNNAAISAINVNDLETAECFLYQASLISDKNGKIVNNMGILACYKNQFEMAKNYFVTAGKYGVNSDYNLQVVQNIYDSNSATPGKFRQELGDHNYYEVLGDASELQKD